MKNLLTIRSCLFGNNIWEISSEELTSLARDNYTAILLRCDPSGGEPQAFYSVEGSLGGPLCVGQDGKLQWDVESAVSSSYSPTTSAYTFNEAGAMIKQEKTDRVNSGDKFKSPEALNCLRALLLGAKLL